VTIPAKMASGDKSNLVNATKRRYCDHCDDYVSKATYFRHYKRASRLVEEETGSGTSTEIDYEVESPDPYPLLDQFANVEEEVGEHMEDDS